MCIFYFQLQKLPPNHMLNINLEHDINLEQELTDTKFMDKVKLTNAKQILVSH